MQGVYEKPYFQETSYDKLGQHLSMEKSMSSLTPNEETSDSISLKSLR